MGQAARSTELSSIRTDRHPEPTGDPNQESDSSQLEQHQNDHRVAVLGQRSDSNLVEPGDRPPKQLGAGPTRGGHKEYERADRDTEQSPTQDTTTDGHHHRKCHESHRPQQRMENVRAAGDRLQERQYATGSDKAVIDGGAVEDEEHGTHRNGHKPEQHVSAARSGHILGS